MIDSFKTRYPNAYNNLLLIKNGNISEFGRKKDQTTLFASFSKMGKVQVGSFGKHLHSLKLSIT